MLKFYLIGFFVIQLFLFKLCVSHQYSEGDYCTLARTGGQGICKLISQCPSAIADIVTNRGFLTQWGFVIEEQIVCCDDPDITTKSQISQITPNRISAQKCMEYTKYVYENISRIDMVTGQEVHEKTLNSGDSDVHIFVVGGTEAKPKEFPHMALIGFGVSYDIQWACGGSIISEQYILTAGHCLRTRGFGPAKYARVGDLELNTDQDDAKPVTMDIAQRIPYPLYRTSSQYYDIALLRLSEKMQFNVYVRPICLPQSFEAGTNMAIATGWGDVEWNNRKLNDQLLKVTLELFTYEECNESLNYERNRKLIYGIKDDSQICAGSHTESKDICEGDSGGPLQIYHSHPYMYEIIGITSVGKVCGTVGYPSIYTRVYPYLDWIESIAFEN